VLGELDPGTTTINNALASVVVLGFGVAGNRYVRLSIAVIDVHSPLMHLRRVVSAPQQHDQC
jgi:hypothetical protein